MAAKLTQEDWLTAGFRMLVDSGPQALKAEVLARKLGATKGSFYWHFKDVPSFRAEMLALWRARALTDIIDGLASIANPKERLRALADAATLPAPESFGGIRAEAAIRAWGLADPIVAKAVAEVDAERMDYLETLLRECGADTAHAALIYAAYVGLDQLVEIAPAARNTTLTHLIDFILSNAD